MSDLGKRLKEVREERGLSMRALSRIIGVSFSSISRAETQSWRTQQSSTVERIEKWINTGEGSEPYRERDPMRDLERRIEVLEEAVGVLLEERIRKMVSR